MKVVAAIASRTIPIAVEADFLVWVQFMVSSSMGVVGAVRGHREDTASSRPTGPTP
jgi:hypothetical protein